MKRKYRVVIDGKAYEVDVEEIGAETVSTTAVRPSSQPSTPPPSTTSRPVTPSRPVSAPVSTRPSVMPKTAPASGTGGKITSPIPGTVLRVNFKVGDFINQGDVLLILEAMKMENEIMAATSGTIKEIVAQNTTVEFGEVLCVIE